MLLLNVSLLSLSFQTIVKIEECLASLPLATSKCFCWHKYCVALVWHLLCKNKWFIRNSWPFYCYLYNLKWKRSLVWKSLKHVFTKAAVTTGCSPQSPITRPTVARGCLGNRTVLSAELTWALPLKGLRTKHMQQSQFHASHTLQRIIE